MEKDLSSAAKEREGSSSCLGRPFAGPSFEAAAKLFRAEFVSSTGWLSLSYLGIVASKASSVDPAFRRNGGGTNAFWVTGTCDLKRALERSLVAQGESSVAGSSFPLLAKAWRKIKKLTQKSVV